jgi:hypothetical protein
MLEFLLRLATLDQPQTSSLQNFPWLEQYILVPTLGTILSSFSLRARLETVLGPSLILL